MAIVARVSGFIPKEMAVVVFPTASVILGDSLIYIVLPISIAEFEIGGALGLSQAFWIGFALSINRFIRLASNSLAAGVYQRFGLRWPFVAATLLGASTTLVYGFSKGILVLILARALWGIAYSHLRLASQLTALEISSPSTRGKLFGLFNSGQRAGSFVAVTGGAFLADATSRQFTFTVLAAIGLLGVAVATQVPAIATGLKSQDARSGEAGAKGGSQTAGDSSFIWNILVARTQGVEAAARWYMLSISYLRFSTAFAANGLVIATITPYLSEVIAGDATVFGFTVSIITLAGVLVGIRWFANLALAVPFGHLADTLGRRPTILIGIGVMLVMLAVIGLAPNLEAVVIALPVLFIAGALLETALDTAMGEAAPDTARASVMARYSTWLDLGAATGPIVGFVIGDAIGFGAGYGIALAIVGSAVILYFSVTGRRYPSTA